jgi:hypothetical protein
MRYKLTSPFDSRDLRPKRALLFGAPPGRGKTAAMLQTGINLLRLTLQRSESSESSRSFPSRPPGRGIPALMVIQDVQQAFRLLRPAASAKGSPPDPGKRSAHLLKSHRRIFPPVAASCATRRRPGPAGTTPGAASARRSCGPRSGSGVTVSRTTIRIGVRSRRVNQRE